MIASSIREARKQQRLTLKELAKLTGIASSNLSRLEQGRLDSRLSTVTTVLDALGLRLSAVPRRRLTIEDVNRRMVEGAERLGEFGIVDRDVDARLAWKASRGLDISVERRLLDEG